MKLKETHKYDDMIHLSRPESRHARMSAHDRAAQFSPFAALTGYDGVIAETARLTDRQLELDEGGKALLDEKLRGMGLHGKMVDKLTAHCAADGRFTHILMTAHPDNKASLCAFTRRGYTVAATKQLYGGVLRRIAVKALQND